LSVFAALFCYTQQCRNGENQHQSCVNDDEKSTGADLVMV